MRIPVSRRDLSAAALYAALAVLLPATGVSNMSFLGPGLQLPLGVSVAMMLIGAVSIVWRRRYPVVPLAVAGPLGLVEIVAGSQIMGYLLLFEAFFEPVMHGSRRVARTTTILAGALTAGVLAVAVAVSGVGPHLVAVVLIAVLVIATPLLWGWEVRHHRDARRSAETLAAAEHELAATRAAHAVETERRTIAHDLHDVIAGHLSAVTLHTSLAETLEDEAARGRSLATARDSARAALRDLRSMITVLADDEPGTLPAVTLDWDSLGNRLRARDPDVRIDIEPALNDPATVDPSVQAALLRIASEAVTNAVLYGLAPISLSVSRVGTSTSADPGAHIQLDLTNRFHPPPNEDPVPTGVGRGAITHRALAVGGSAVSGPDPQDPATWRVRALLPTHPAHSTLQQKVAP